MRLNGDLKNTPHEILMKTKSELGQLTRRLRETRPELSQSKTAREINSLLEKDTEGAHPTLQVVAISERERGKVHWSLPQFLALLEVLGLGAVLIDRRTGVPLDDNLQLEEGLAALLDKEDTEHLAFRLLSKLNQQAERPADTVEDSRR